MKEWTSEDWLEFEADMIEKFGKPEKAEMPTEAELAFYKDKLPDRILGIWARFGFSSFRKGCRQLVRPQDYADALAKWIKGTEFEGKDQYHVIIVSAFGEMRIWGEKSGKVFDIEPFNHYIFYNGRDNTKEISRGGVESAAEGFLYGGMDGDADDSHGPMYPRARKALGPLAHNEIYGFVPALLLGGKDDAANLQRLDGPTYLSMLAELKKPPIIGMKELGAMAFGAGAHDLVSAELDKDKNT